MANTERNYPPVPETLHALLRMAISDARSLDRSKYRPSSDQWHIQNNPEVCIVCDAGAVIARRLLPVEHENLKILKTAGSAVLPRRCAEHAWGDNRAPTDYPNNWHNALMALDQLRMGRVFGAVQIFYGSLKKMRLGTADRVNLLVFEGIMGRSSRYCNWQEFDDHLERAERLALRLASVDL